MSMSRAGREQLKVTVHIVSEYPFCVYWYIYIYIYIYIYRVIVKLVPHLSVLKFCRLLEEHSASFQEVTT